MSDILILGDVHAQPKDIIRQLDISKHMGYAPKAILQLGDIGIWKDVIHDFPPLEIPLYFILGNHENFHAELLIKGLPKCYIHLKPNAPLDICGLKTIGIGKSNYIDIHNTPPGSTIRYEDIEACKKSPPFDIIVTHDCPTDIGMQSNFFGPWEPVGSIILKEILVERKPKLWLFAHHHMDYTVAVDGCHFIGFKPANDGFGILNTEFKSIRFASSITEK